MNSFILVHDSPSLCVCTLFIQQRTPLLAHIRPLRLLKTRRVIAFQFHIKGLSWNLHNSVAVAFGLGRALVAVGSCCALLCTFASLMEDSSRIHSRQVVQLLSKEITVRKIWRAFKTKEFHSWYFFCLESNGVNGISEWNNYMYYKFHFVII